MNKKIIITISTILGLTVIAGGFLVLQKTRKQEMVNNQQKQKVEVVKNDENESKQKTENQEKDNQNNQENTLSKNEKEEILTAFLNYLKENDEDDFIFYKDKQLNIYSVNIYKDKYLYGSISFKGSHSNPYILALKEKNRWIVVFWGQDHPSCKIIDKYNIPNEIYDACFLNNFKLRCAPDSKRCS